MNLTAAARSLAFEKDVDTWSKLLLARCDDRHLLKIAKLVDPTVSTAGKTSKLPDARVRFAYVNSDATLGVATTIAVYDDESNDAVIDVDGRFAVGNSSDNIWVMAPFRVDLDELQSSFLSLVPLKDATESKLLFVADPDKFPESITYPGCPVSETNNLNRLGFGNANVNEETPRFAVLPKLCPVPAGFFLPDNAKFTAELPAAPTGASQYDKFFMVWFNAVRLLFQKNGGKGLNHPDSTLFEPNEVPVDSLPTPPVALSPSIVAKTKALRYSSPQGNTARLNSEEAVETELLLWYQRNSTGIPATANPTGLGTALTVQELIAASSSAVATAVAKAQLETPDATTRADSKAKDDVKARYRILFGHNGRDTAASEEYLVPAELGSDVLDVLSQKTDNWTEAFQAAFQLFFGQLASVRGLNWTILSTINKTMLYSVLVKALLRFNWLSVPLVRDRASIHALLSVVHLLPVGAANHEFNEILNKDATANAEQRHEIDTTKHAAKHTKLFTGGSQRSVNDVKSAIYNLFLLGRFFAPDDFERSQLFNSLTDYMMVLSTEEGMAWIHEFDSPAVTHNVLMDVTTIVTFFVSVAADIGNRRDLASGQLIDASKLGNAKHLSEQIVNKLRLSVSSMVTGPYGMEPVTFALFNPSAKRPSEDTDRNPSTKQARNGQGKTPKDGKSKDKPDEGSPSKTKALTLDEKARRDASRTKGFLQVDPTKRNTPGCNHLFPLKSGASEKGRLCLGESILGRGCKNNPCPYAHITDPSKLSAADKQALIAYVDATEGVTFVQGKRPGAPSG